MQALPDDAQERFRRALLPFLRVRIRPPLKIEQGPNHLGLGIVPGKTQEEMKARIIGAILLLAVHYGIIYYAPDSLCLGLCLGVYLYWLIQELRGRCPSREFLDWICALGIVAFAFLGMWYIDHLIGRHLFTKIFTGYICTGHVLKLFDV